MSDELRDLFDEEPSEEELAEAAALARALERETLAESDLDALQPALQAGHLLQMARAPEPSEARLDQLYAELEASLPATPPVAHGKASGWRGLRAWWLLVTGAGAAAALALWLTARDSWGSAPLATLPPPTIEVLQAQLSEAQRATDGTAGAAGDDARPLARAMRPYRAELLAQLATEYSP